MSTDYYYSTKQENRSLKAVLRAMDVETQPIKWECTECCEYLTDTTDAMRCPLCGSHHIVPAKAAV